MKDSSNRKIFVYLLNVQRLVVIRSSLIRLSHTKHYRGHFRKRYMDWGPSVKSRTGGLQFTQSFVPIRSRRKRLYSSARSVNLIPRACSRWTDMAPTGTRHVIGFKKAGSDLMLEDLSDHIVQSHQFQPGVRWQERTLIVFDMSDIRPPTLVSEIRQLMRMDHIA